MEIYKGIRAILCALCVVTTVPLPASLFTQWTEFPKGLPLYNPYPPTGETGTEDYFPCVIYDKNNFSSHGTNAPYKMWHQGLNNTLALSTSFDGILWSGPTQTSGLPSGVNGSWHACVLYNAIGFGGTHPYKIWCYSGIPQADTLGTATALTAIVYAESDDGITWFNAQNAQQNPADHPLVAGDSGSYFYHLYGPGFLIYNPSPTSTPGQPYSYPYAMFFDTASESPSPSGSIEAIGLAYSSDGIHWTRFGNQPTFIPSGSIAAWDGTYAYRPSVIKLDNVYHMSLLQNSTKR